MLKLVTLQQHVQCSERAPHLKLFKTLVDAGWFLDIPSFSPSGWFTFRSAAKSLMQNMNATFDRQAYIDSCT